MRIEEEIQQSKPFESTKAKAMVNVLFTSGWLSQSKKELFKKYGLTIKQYNILRILKGSTDPLSTKVIRERMLDRSSDVSRIIDRMAPKGLVIKEVCPLDKRKVNIVISQAGEESLEKIKLPLEEWLSSCTGLTEEEAELLSSLLDKMRK